MEEKGVALFVGAEEGQSYWQPKPSTGYVTVKVSPYNSPNDLISAGVQVLEPGASVRRLGPIRDFPLMQRVCAIFASAGQPRQVGRAWPPFARAWLVR